MNLTKRTLEGALGATVVAALLTTLTTTAHAKPKPKAAPVQAVEATTDDADSAQPADEGATSHASLKDEEGEGVEKDKEPAATVEPPHEEWRSTDVEELPTKRYYFVGLRYRGNVIPKFMLNMFVDGGKTIYSNTIGAEFDIRKDGFSLIPALSYTEYGTGDVLFKDKNADDIAGNYSVVNSSMKAVYASVDLLWSAKISKNVEFEYGAGFGFGVLFGSLTNNWVHEDPNGTLTADNGKTYSACETTGPVGCNARDHRNSDVNKVGGYTEDTWLNGGSVPVVFPMISIPQIGLRFKPVKEFTARLGVGFSLTGFWFGLSGNYGLEQRPKP